MRIPGFKFDAVIIGKCLVWCGVVWCGVVWYDLVWCVLLCCVVCCVGRMGLLLVRLLQRGTTGTRHPF